MFYIQLNNNNILQMHQQPLISHNLRETINNGMTTQQKWDPSGIYFGHKLNPAVECDFISLTLEVLFLHPRDHLSKLLKSGSSWNYAINYTKWEGHDLYLDTPPPPHPV